MIEMFVEMTLDTCDFLKVHKIKSFVNRRIRGHKESIYTQIMSVSAYFFTYNEDVKSNRDYHGIHHFEYDDRFDQLPIVEHETLWDFYKAIGYNHKTKKYMVT